MSDGTLNKPYKLYMYGKQKEDPISVKQFDTGSRFIDLALFSYKEEQYIIPFGAEVRIYVKKQDGKTVWSTCTDVTMNTLKAPLTAQSISVCGPAVAEIYIKFGETDIRSQSFGIIVEKAIGGDDAVESSDEFRLLEQRITEWDEKNAQVTDILIDLHAKYDGLEAEYATELTEVKSSLEEMEKVRSHLQEQEMDGLVFAVEDVNKKPAIAVLNNGLVVISKFAVGNNRFTQASTTDVTYAIIDSSGKMSELRIDAAGNVPTDIIDRWMARMSKTNTIVCWGDSLTFGEGGNINGWHTVDYPKTLSELSGQPVINNGVQGERTIEIMARQGANPMVVNNLIIPATCTKVKVGDSNGVLTSDGSYAKILQLGASGINPCYIGDIRGYLTLENFGTEDAAYYFTRSEEGVQILIGSSVITTFSMQYHTGGIAIFWVGANGGWENTSGTRDPSILISQIKSMIAYGGYKDYLVVLCREIDSLYTISDFDYEFNGKFMHLKPLLYEYGLKEACINTTDITYKNGIPTQLDAGDGLHLNYYGYQVVGKFIYKKLKEMEAL